MLRKRFLTDEPQARPFLKWAGGKGQLLEQFGELYPPALKQGKIKNYYEPFVGSGAVFFDIVRNYKIENAYLYDVNDDLVLAYQVIQRDVIRLIELLSDLQKKYLNFDKEERRDFFYEQRESYNRDRVGFDYSKPSDDWVKRATQLIFLNRTCYNGLYRVNSKGGFNSPAGDYANPKICDETNLIAVSSVLQRAEIKKADFSEVLADLKPKAFVYFDPPYRPISKTAGFNAYSKNVFGDAEQTRLAKLFSEIGRKEAFAMLSNSDPKNIDPNDQFFDDLYKGNPIVRIPARRLINSDASKRGAINEIVVTNYNASGKILTR
jgi:DNA adenine methylase